MSKGNHKGQYSEDKWREGVTVQRRRWQKRSRKSAAIPELLVTVALLDSVKLVVSTYLSKENDECSELLILLGRLEEENLELSRKVPLLLQELLTVRRWIALDAALELQEIHAGAGRSRQ